MHKTLHEQQVATSQSSKKLSIFSQPSAAKPNSCLDHRYAYTLDFTERDSDTTTIDAV